MGSRHTGHEDSLAGLVSLEDLQAAVEREDITTVMAAVPDMLGRLQGKRLNAPIFLDRIANGLTASEACAYILATNVGMDPLGAFDLTGWDKGFQDIGVVADLDTLRILPHQPGVALVHGDAVHPDGASVPIAPRHVLRTQLDHLAALGFEARVGLESEFVLCEGGQPVARHNLDYALDHPPALSDFIRCLEEVLPKSGVPVEATKTEGAAGQVEVTFPYGPALPACDDYTVYKQTVRDLSRRRGLTATFMAAPFTGVGSGLHIHLSLLKDGSPAFTTGAGEDLPETMQHSIAGLLSAMPHLAPLYAPNPNSYKRYATAHSFAPQYMNWGRDNRGCAVRVTGHGEGSRLEIRLPGADANPYLALAASLAAIVHGLTEELTPPDPCRGDAYADLQAPRVRRDLTEAVAYFDGSDLAEGLFGAGVVRHYAIAAHTEVAEHRRQVTDVERERGFERA
ncbi:glutamine synthetase family protein [Streptomyces sp. NPDC088254]|uniref:glutamine synthetase family protein n=1 Tax=Streptomyces sp. NPDC088254 TaxID=3365847 RepID=UPI003802C99E